VALDHTIGFQLAKLIGQNLFRNFAQFSAQFGKAQLTAGKGADVPPGMPPGPAGAKQYVGGAYKKFPDIHVEILDLIAEDDKMVVRNRWTGTEAASGEEI
jgi:hypothetical protein